MLFDIVPFGGLGVRGGGLGVCQKCVVAQADVCVLAAMYVCLCLRGLQLFCP